MRKSIARIAIPLLITLIAPATVYAQQVTFETLLDEMVDRDELARTPVHAYTLRQASSYDRASKTPGGPGWYANQDGGGYIRTETNQGRTERVLMDVEGPGAVVRFWSTYLTWAFTDGTLRFYFDGSDTPAIEAPFTEIFNGTHLAKGILATTTGGFLENNHILGGRNLYLPLPYANGCKITYEGTDNPFYFAINYREYAPGTPVKTFAMDALKRNADKLAGVEEELVENTSVTENAVLSSVKGRTLAPGESSKLTITGGRAIRGLTLRIDADNYRQALRSTVIAIAFDGEETVWAPVGDFFGTGYRLSEYESRYHKVTLDGTMRCRWVMPFERAATVTVHNHGDQPVTLEQFDAHHTLWDWDERSLYFHASWTQYPEAPTARGRDTNYVSLRGKGKYVGDSLAIFNATTGQEGQPWWGEGDEKIYTDGETFPSQFGTGTEDYYGYAWVGSPTFSQPFLSQPISQGNRGRGLTVNGRWRMLDAMPFNSSLKLDMEIWSWVGGVSVDYAPTVFWYGPHGTRAVTALGENAQPRPNDLAGVQRAVRDVEHLEVEGMVVRPGHPGERLVHTVPNDRRLSNRSYWLMRGLKKGDEASAEFRFDKQATGTLELVCVRSPKSVVVDILINGRVVQADVDLYAGGIEPLKLEIAGVTLNEGVNRLTVRVKGANAQAKDADEFGVDTLRLHAD